jgi:hypothetical protein
MNSRRFHCLRPRRFSLARLEQGNASGGTGINGSACAAAIWTRGSRLRVMCGEAAGVRAAASRVRVSGHGIQELPD